jgi:hypothetical protein
VFVQRRSREPLLQRLQRLSLEMTRVRGHDDETSGSVRCRRRCIMRLTVAVKRWDTRSQRREWTKHLERGGGVMSLVTEPAENLSPFWTRGVWCEQWRDSRRESALRLRNLDPFSGLSDRLRSSVLRSCYVVELG